MRSARSSCLKRGYLSALGLGGDPAALCGEALLEGLLVGGHLARGFEPSALAEVFEVGLLQLLELLLLLLLLHVLQVFALAQSHPQRLQLLEL